MATAINTLPRCGALLLPFIVWTSVYEHAPRAVISCSLFYCLSSRRRNISLTLLTTAYMPIEQADTVGVV